MYLLELKNINKGYKLSGNEKFYALNDVNLVIMVTHSEKVASQSSRVIKIADGKIIDDTKIFNLEKNSEREKIILNKKRQNLNIVSAIKLALVNMREKLVRNICISIGASIGIMSVILMLSLGNGVKSYFNNTMNSYVNPLVIEVNMPSNEDETIDLDITTIEKPNITDSNVDEGALPKEGEILINRSVKDKLGKDIIGKKVTLHIFVNQKMIKKEFIVSGIYATAGGDLTAVMKSVFLNYSDLEKLYSENNNELKSNVMYINTSSNKYTDAIKEKVKELGYTEYSQDQMSAMFNEMINILTYVLAGIAAISLVVSTIMIIVVMYISVVERTKEIGIIKAIGAREKDIRRIFVCEAFLIGVFSGILGLSFSFLLMKGINIISTKMFDINLVLINNSYIVFSVGASIIISTVAGLLPANKAAKLDPVESLRRE